MTSAPNRRSDIKPFKIYDKEFTKEDVKVKPEISEFSVIKTIMVFSFFTVFLDSLFFGSRYLPEAVLIGTFIGLIIGIKAYQEEKQKVKMFEG